MLEMSSSIDWWCYRCWSFCNNPKIFDSEVWAGGKWFGIIINYLVESPFEMTRTLPKFDRVVLVFGKEPTQFLENSYYVKLVWMGFTVKDFLCSVNGIDNDNNFGYVLFAGCLVDTTSDGKKFCFSTCNVCCMVNYLCQRVVVYMHMRYRCSNVFFDASICYNDGCIWRRRQLQCHFVELLRVFFVIFLSTS